MNVFRRLPISRLLLLCGLVVAIGISATALASAVGSGSVPPPKPLAQAVHDALSGGRVDGFSAHVKLTNRLVEGADLASGEGQGAGLAGSPLLTGAAGRVWVAADGRMRLELQAEKGDTQVIYDGHTLQAYDASTNTLYRYTPDRGAHLGAGGDQGASGPPSLKQVEEAIEHVREHANVSGATPTDVGGQAAYTVRVSPKEAGSLIGGAELSFDAAHGLPLRAAVFSSTSSAPVIELAASDVAYGTVDASTFSFSPPAGVKVEEIRAPAGSDSTRVQPPGSDEDHPKLTTHGQGVDAIAVLEGKAKGGGGGSEESGLDQLPKVKVNGTNASELRTALGTILTFERGGVRYLVAGAVAPPAVEAIARGL